MMGDPLTVDGGAPAQPSIDDLFQRAEQAFKAGRYDEAAPIYRQLSASQVSPGVMSWRLAAIANAQGALDQAWELYHQAVRLDPKLAASITASDVPHHDVVCKPHYDSESVPLCPVCGGADQKPMMVVCYLEWAVYHASFSPVRRWVQCQACGHGFANPRPAKSAIEDAFREPPPPHLLTWDYSTLTAYSDIIHRLWQRRPGGDWLDVGAASGGLAAVAMDFGYRVTGLDIHPGYADFVRRLGVEFLLGDIADYDFHGRRFDIVSMGDVIEHVVDPKKAIARVASILKPGGLIWLSTPNYEGVWTRAMREKDAMWKEGEHFHFFCLRSLNRLLRDQRLKAVDYHLCKRFVGCAEVTIERVKSDELAE
jgi:SAM-dependent methyltransferase